MKVFLLALITLTVSAEVFAQRGRGNVDRGGSVTNPNTGRVRDLPGRDDGRPGRGGDRPSDYRPTSRYERPLNERYERPIPRYDYPTYDYPNYSVRVNPRYVPYGRPGRVLRNYRRAPLIWSVPFGYSCGLYGDLMVNGRYVHNFYFSSDCHQAVQDIRLYGDFCDGADLFDQSGMLEAQFSSSYECREALGWYF